VEGPWIWPGREADLIGPRPSRTQPALGKMREGTHEEEEEEEDEEEIER